MTVKITLKNQILASNFFWITSFGLVLFSWYLHFQHDFVLAFIVVQIVFSLPGWYLHIEYYLKNRGQEITITSNSVTVKDKNGERQYSNTEIEKIIFYSSGGKGFLSKDSYNYANVKLKSGEEIIITRLLTPKVEEFVKTLYGVPFEKKVVFFANIGSR